MLKTSSVVPSPDRQSENCAQGAQCSPWLSHQGWPDEIMLSGGQPCNRKIGAMTSVIEVCAPDDFHRLDRACIGSQLSKLPYKKSSYRGHTQGEVLRPASKSTWASGLMRQRKRSCLPMARRLQSIGSMTTGLALLAATCPMSWIVTTEIWRTQARPRGTGQR